MSYQSSRIMSNFCITNQMPIEEINKLLAPHQIRAKKSQGKRGYVLFFRNKSYKYCLNADILAKEATSIISRKTKTATDYEETSDTLKMKQEQLLCSMQKQIKELEERNALLELFAGNVNSFLDFIINKPIDTIMDKRRVVRNAVLCRANYKKLLEK